jgi:hypothetical protein
MYDDPLTLYRRAIDHQRRGLFMNKDGAPDPAARLNWLRTEHRDLDAAIDALERELASDQLQLARFKKRKLRLRDEIARIEDSLVPDIIA